MCNIDENLKKKKTSNCVPILKVLNYFSFCLCWKNKYYRITSLFSFGQIVQIMVIYNCGIWKLQKI